MVDLRASPRLFAGGETLVAPIGIPDTVLDRVRPDVAANDPQWWLSSFPWPGPESHKYTRGHALIAGGAVMTGAARLAARAAARLGGGLVTVAAPEAAFPIYAAALTGVIVQPVDDIGQQESQFLRRNAEPDSLDPANPTARLGLSSVNGERRDRCTSDGRGHRPHALDPPATGGG